jgi:hypothetical protein
MRFQQNDPAYTFLFFEDLCNDEARRYGEALQNNTAVQKNSISGL